MNGSHWEERGQFGDMFGAVNALFSGFAFAGIIVTILLQREELTLQRQELELTREELKLTRKEFEDQNLTLSRQRFENTFFNMLTIHHQTLQDLQSYDQKYAGRKVLMALIDGWNSNLYENKIQHFSPEKLLTYISSYKDYSAGFYYDISHYLQSLSGLYSLIKTNSLIEPQEKEYYFGILKTYISFPERRFLFYHLSLGNTHDSSIETLRHMENDLKVLGTVASSSLLHPSHIEILKALE